MHRIVSTIVIICCASRVQAQLRIIPRVYELGTGRISATTTAYFDTIATYVEGKVVSLKTQQSIEGATIKMNYQDAFKAQIRTTVVTSEKDGKFRLGWVGTGKKRPLSVRANKYIPRTTKKVETGGLTQLQIELFPVEK